MSIIVSETPDADLDNRGEAQYEYCLRRLNEELRHYPKERHEEIKMGLRDICYLQEFTTEASEWKKEQWAEVQKSNIYTYNGIELDFSQVDMNFIPRGMHYNQAIVLDFARKRTRPDYRKHAISRLDNSPRHRLWNNFVNQIDGKHPNLLVHLAVIQVAHKRFTDNRTEETENNYSNAMKSLNECRPNYAEYNPIQEKAENGDEETAKILDEVTNMPARGWESVRHLAIRDGMEMMLQTKMIEQSGFGKLIGGGTN